MILGMIGKGGHPMKTHLNTLTIVIFVLMSLAGCAVPATQAALVQPAATPAPEVQAAPTEPPVSPTQPPASPPTATVSPIPPTDTAEPTEVVTAAPTPTPPVRGESDLMFTFANERCSYEGPPVIPSGPVNVIMNMQGQDKYKIANVVLFFTLDPDYDLKDLIDAFWMSAPPEWARLIFSHGAYPGEVTNKELTVESGPLYYVCESGESEDSGKLVGKGGPLEVSP
jgi:hypothetical protein